VWIASIETASPKVSLQPSASGSCSYSAPASPLTWIVAPVARARRPWPEDVVGVVVGLQHVLDPHAVQAGELHVGIDVPLRVYHGGHARAGVSDQIEAQPRSSWMICLKSI
jgi:hypothetical protein